MPNDAAFAPMRVCAALTPKYWLCRQIFLTPHHQLHGREEGPDELGLLVTDGLPNTL